ncbi:hypothetical protein DFH28DRAFT_1125314 [Melampsora americana]|nr:hypothetical protein DFH28DRAFT_1125314 [Melampsora americana]
MSDVETGFNALQTENQRRLKPLKQLISEGKKLSQSDERFSDCAGNLIDQTLVLMKIMVDVAQAASQFNKNKLKRLELLVLEFNQTREAVISKKPTEESKGKNTPQRCKKNEEAKAQSALAQPVEVLDWHKWNLYNQSKTAQLFAAIYPELNIKQPQVPEWIQDKTKI